MTTTTLRMDAGLKARVRRAATRHGTTPHGFMLQAIVEKASTEEQRSDFHAEADRRYAKVLATGKSIPWSEMKNYLQGRLKGEKVSKPRSRQLAR